MSISPYYIPYLLRLIRARPCIWDKKSEFYGHEDSVERNWEELTAEVRIMIESVDVTVSDVKFTWNSLLNTYDSCLMNGNSQTFTYFEDMEFLGDETAWYHNPQKKFNEDSESEVAQLLERQCGINGIIFIILFVTSCYQVRQVVMAPKEMLLYIIYSCLFYLPLGGFIPKYAEYYTKFYSRLNVPFVCLLILVPVMSYMIEQEVILNLSSAKDYISPGLCCFFLVLTSLVSILATHNCYSTKKPFPVSKLLATFNLGLSMVWTNVVCFILKTIQTKAIFYMIPIWVASTALMSYFFCSYLWDNVDLLFPNFNENPYEMLPKPNNPYQIEFNQKPRNTATKQNHS